MKNRNLYKTSMRQASMRFWISDFLPMIVVAIGLFFGAKHIGNKAVASDMPIGEFVFPAMIILFALALIALLYGQNDKSWYAGKEIVELEDFLKIKKSILAPNLDNASRDLILNDLKVAIENHSISKVLVGVDSQPGKTADRILIQTVETQDKMGDMLDSLGGEWSVDSKIKYKENNGTVTQTSFVVVWD